MKRTRKIMKEITREFNLRVTMITRAEDELADQMVLNARTESMRRSFADMFKAVLDVDNVQVKDVKDFVRDVEE